MQAVLNAVKNFVQQWWPYLIGLIGGPLGLLVVWVIRHWDDIKGAFSAALNWINDKIVKPVMGRTQGSFAGGASQVLP